MKKTIRRFIGKLVGRRFRSFWFDYSVVPRLLFQELRRILTLIRCGRKYADNPEVLLCGLRISAHIVDKGLQADRWEEGRSGIFYEKMCEQIERLKDSTFNTDPSYQWAVKRKLDYEEAQKSGQLDCQSIERAPTKIAKDDLLYLLQGRRSVRSFVDRPVEPEILKELANVMSWSPTSCNRQPANLFITQNPEKVATCLKQCAGATCFGETTPCFIAVCADTRFYMIQDRYLPLIDVSLGLQNMLLLAHSQGIGGTVLNWMHHTPRENAILRKTLGIPEYYLIALNILIGYPKKSAPAPGRKSCDLAYKIVE